VRRFIYKLVLFCSSPESSGASCLLVPNAMTPASIFRISGHANEKIKLVETILKRLLLSDERFILSYLFAIAS
jgi:hypothetical protein